MRDMVKAQKANTAIKEKELAIESDRIKSNERLALASIDAQKQDRLAQMRIVSKFEGFKYMLWGAFVVGVFSFAVYAMHSQNTTFFMDVLKMAAPLVAGALGGYGYGRYTTIQEKTPTDE